MSTFKLKDPFKEKQEDIVSTLLDRCNLLSTKIACISELCFFYFFPDKANLEIKTKKLGGEKKAMMSGLCMQLPQIFSHCTIFQLQTSSKTNIQHFTSGQATKNEKNENLLNQYRMPCFHSSECLQSRIPINQSLCHMSPSWHPENSSGQFLYVNLEKRTRKKNTLFCSVFYKRHTFCATCQCQTVTKSVHLYVEEVA